MGRLRIVLFIGALATLILVLKNHIEGGSRLEGAETSQRPGQAAETKSEIDGTVEIVSPADVEETPAEFVKEVSNELAVVSKTDQGGVNRLRERLVEFVEHSSYEEQLAALNASLSSEEVRFNFLLIGTLIQQSPQFGQLLEAILKTKDEHPVSKDPEAISNLELIQAYALDEYSQRLQARGKGQNGDQEFMLPLLLQRAETSPNLAIVRGSVRAINSLADQPEKYWAQIKNQRPASESFAFADLMGQ